MVAFGDMSGRWCHEATVRMPIPRCAAKASFVIRNAACRAHALRPDQMMTDATGSPVPADAKIGCGALRLHC